MNDDHADSTPSVDACNGSSPLPPAIGSIAPRRPRRWRRRVAVVAFLLAVLIVSIPWLASTGPGRGLLLAWLNGQIAGTVRLDSLALSWFGPCQARGVRLLDQSGREVLTSDEIKMEQGLLATALAHGSIEELNLRSVRTQLNIDSSNNISLLQSFQQRPNPASAPDSAEAAERFEMRASSVGVAWQNGKLRIKTRDPIDAVRLGSADADSRQLLSITKLEVMQNDDHFSIAAEAAGSCEQATQWLTGQSSAEGLFQLSIAGTVGAEDFKGKVSADIQAFRMPGEDSAVHEPVSARLQLEAEQTARRTRAVLSAGGQIGVMEVSLDYAKSDPALPFTVRDLLDALAAGNATQFPQLRLVVNSDLNLAAVAQAAPQLLRIRRHGRITSGNLHIQELAVESGDRLAIRGRVEMGAIEALSGDRRIGLPPLTVDLDAEVEPLRGLVLREAKLDSPLAHVIAGGDAGSARAEFEADLARIYQELNEVVDLGTMQMGGIIAGNLDLKRVDEERLHVGLSLTARELEVHSGAGRLSLPLTSLVSAADVGLVDARIKRVSVSALRLDVRDKLAVEATGWYDFADDSFTTTIEMTRAQLAFLSEQLEHFENTALRGFAGQATLHAALRRDRADSPIGSSGVLAVDDLDRDGRSLSGQTVFCRWSDALVDFSTPSVQAAGLAFETEAGKVLMEQGRLSLSEPLSISGRVGGTVDVASALKLAGHTLNWKSIPPVAGSLTLQNHLQVADETIACEGEARVENLTIGEGRSAFKDKQVRIEFGAQIQPSGGLVQLDRMNVEATGLLAQAHGDVTDYKRSCAVNIAGSYKGQWASISPAINNLFPEIRNTITLKGETGGNFQLAGEACGENASPLVQRLRGEVQVGWSSAELWGLPLGGARIAPALHQGAVRVPQVQVTVSGGQAAVGGIIDLSGKFPVLRIPGTVQLLDNVRIDEATAESLLSRVNPVFGDLAGAEGTASLRSRDIELPLGAELQRGGAGEGHLDLTRMKVQPRGLLAELLRLGGLDDKQLQSVQVSGVDFQIREGRIHYGDFRMNFARQFDLRFYGSVGFDDTLDLVVSIPVQSGLLSRLPEGRDASGILKVLSGARVEIPIVGTRQHPRLDLSNVDLTKILLPDKSLIPDLIDIIGGDKPPDSSKKRAPARKDGPKPPSPKGAKRRPAKNDDGSGGG